MPHVVRTRRTRRTAALVLAAILTLAPGVWAAPQRVQAAAPAAARGATSVPSVSFRMVWRLMAHFLIPEGCTLDPSGRCGGSANGSGSGSGVGAGASGENGCTLDPSGVAHCHP